MEIKIPDKYKKIIVEGCRIILGLLFIFSGFVKAVDPFGFGYKIQDYLVAFNLDLFSPLALPASIFLSAFEFALGVCLLVGVYRQIIALFVLLFMCFMTPLTFYLALANPVTDCGCFGDAWVITNWETFYKNLFLLAAAIIVFLWKKQMTFLFSKKSHSLVVLFTSLFIVSTSLYCYAYLPILDFRPYKIGNNIIELMTIPDGEEMDEYETLFVYEKDGVKQEFTIENYPKGDSGWTFVDSESKLIKKGYEPPIHDFVITDEYGDDITEDVLLDTTYTFFLVSHKLEKASDSNIDKINEIYDYAKQNGYKFYCLTSSLPDEINNWKESTGAEYPFCTMDDITLKTIIRSNPGLVLIKDAIVINKWSDRKIPAEEDIISPLEESELGIIPVNHDVRKTIFLSLFLIIPLAFLYFLACRKKKKTLV